MNIFKTLFLIFIPFSTLLPYSYTCGSPLVTDFTANYFYQRSELIRSSDLGSLTTFLVRNLSTNDLEEIQFQLLATDGVSNFYGEVSEISNNHIDLSTIETLFQAFTASTLEADSLNLQNGIKSAEESILGAPPTINGSSDVNILFMDVRDGSSNSGEFVAGFFDPQDQNMCLHHNTDPQLEATENTCVAPYEWTSNGNGLNIIYIDSNPSYVNEDELENTLFTLAHEYQHLLHWNSDLKEGYFGSTDGGWTFHNPWINEGLSDLMPSILGLGSRDFSPFLSNSTIGLDEWAEIGSSSTLPYYAKSALFFQYLYESEGLDLVGEIFNSSEQGLASIKSKYDDKGFGVLYLHWLQSLVVGELEVTELDKEVYSDNLIDYISMGLQNTTIEIKDILPKYSFSLFSVSDFLSFQSVESSENLYISLFNDGNFIQDEDLAQGGINRLEKIVLYSMDDYIADGSFELSYDYISSPNKKNLFVYPNPVTDNVLSYIYFGGDVTDAMSITLYDLKGRLIFSKRGTMNAYGNYDDDLVLALSSGIYILQSELDSGISESRLITIIK